jgi:ribosome-binding protein aMBF1 (putative translation factor)
MRKKIDTSKLQSLTTVNDLLAAKYGEAGSLSHDEFKAKAVAWYYAEVLKNARKAAGLTQQQLADIIGKKREYIARIEKGETDMQLSTFLQISEAVGLRFGLMV